MVRYLFGFTGGEAGPGKGRTGLKRGGISIRSRCIPFCICAGEHPGSTSNNRAIHIACILYFPSYKNDTTKSDPFSFETFNGQRMKN